MKLLFDENLSVALPRLLADIYPGSAHLRDLGLKGVEDRVVWAYAAAHGYLIVTKDDDLAELSVLRGSPPKLAMIRLGNCSTRELEKLLRANRDRFDWFERDRVASVIEIW